MVAAVVVVVAVDVAVAVAVASGLGLVGIRLVFSSISLVRTVGRERLR